MGLIISLLWILFYVVLIIGVFLAVLWVLEYAGVPVPPPVRKFGVLLIGLLALIWLITVVVGSGGFQVPGARSGLHGMLPLFGDRFGLHGILPSSRWLA